MKKIHSLILLAILISCNTVQEPVPVDLVAEEAAINDVVETLFKSIDERDINLLASAIADDGIFMGTDPDELFTKDTIVNSWAKLMEMPEIPPFEMITDPFIRIHPDGKTAVVAYQYYWKLFTPIPLRQTFWMVKTDSTWVIDFFDFSFILHNEQIPLLNEAVTEEKE